MPRRGVLVYKGPDPIGKMEIPGKVEVRLMRLRLLLAFCVAVGVMMAGTPTMAHHAFAAEFDANRPLTLKGTVTRMEWINPHSWIHIDVKNDDGTVDSWMIEGGAPQALLRRGFNKASLQPGTVILVEGYQAKDGALRGNGRDITFEDGTKLFLGSSGTGAPLDGRDPTQR